MNQKMEWLKKVEGEKFYTLVRRKEFIIEKVELDVIQIRIGRDMGLLVEIPNKVILENEKTLLDKKILFMKDIKSSAGPRSRSYIIAILAFKYEGLIRINSRPLSIEFCERDELEFRFEHERKLSPEELEEILKLQREIGDKAENIVINYEKEKLRKCKLTNLIDKIMWTSRTDCTAGYDIRSFDEQGNQIYIEVKGTVYETSEIFKLTGNELNRAKKEGDRYFIYHVKNANSEKPTLSILLNPFKLIAEKKIQTDPSEYIVGYIADYFDKQCL